VDDVQVGARIRAIRVRLGLRQIDVAQAARVSQPTISRMERGHLGRLSLETVRAIAAVLEIRIDLVPRWRGGDLERAVNARHAALHEAVARRFGDWPEWALSPEVSFSIYGERGVIDILAWHARSRALLVIELKSDIVDPQELVASIDRKRRLAVKVGAERGLSVRTVGAWVIVADGTTNRRRVGMHAAFLATAFRADGTEMRAWLRDPSSPIAGLSFMPIAAMAGRRLGARQRVRRPTRRPRR
jgi:transcriptional regulator with XRE-family HTH domain